MSADPGQIEVGASLRAAILRARVARGAKPTLDVSGRIGGADVQIGVSGGKPSIAVSREWRF